jgi:hypothetical protein
VDDLTCPHCGASTASQVSVCLSCGKTLVSKTKPPISQTKPAVFPVKKTNSLKKTFGLIVGAAILIGIFSSIFISKESQTKAPTLPSMPPPSYALSVTELCTVYNSNEVSADNKYKNHIVELTGKVENISKGPLDGIYVKIGEKGVFNSITCSFDSKQSDSISVLTPGQKVTVVGRVAGKIVGTVHLRECSLE